MFTWFSLILVKKSPQLFLILLGMMIIRFIVLVVSNDKNLLTNLVSLIKHEVVNVCLVFSCALLDKLILLNDIRIGINIAVLFTSLVILDELMSVLDGVGKTPSSIFVIEIIKKLTSILSSKNK